jgi:Glycosyl hydrolase family 26
MVKRVRSAIVLALVAAMFAAVVPSTWAAASVPFGAYAGKRGSENAVTAYQHLETQLGRPLDIVRIFYEWNSSFNVNSPNTLEGFAAANGKIPVMSIKTRLGGKTPVPWQDIIDARPGDPLYQDMVRWANRVKSFPGPVYLCFNHEASNWKSEQNGTSQQYKAAWKKFHKVFKKRHVNNVIWTWIMGDPTPWEVSTTDRRYGPKWYPGNKVTDVLAVDVYNWSPCNGANDPWRSFADLTSEFLKFAAKHPDKATMVTEFGTGEQPGNDMGKADWITQMAEDVKSWNNLQALMSFNSQYNSKFGCHWWLDSSQNSLDAARAVANQPYYGGPGV